MVLTRCTEKCAIIYEVLDTAEGVELQIFLFEPMAMGDSFTLDRSSNRSFSVSQMRTLDDEPIKAAEEGATVKIILAPTSQKFSERTSLYKATAPARSAASGGRNRR